MSLAPPTKITYKRLIGLIIFRKKFFVTVQQPPLPSFLPGIGTIAICEHFWQNNCKVAEERDSRQFTTKRERGKYLSGEEGKFVLVEKGRRREEIVISRRGK